MSARLRVSGDGRHEARTASEARTRLRRLARPESVPILRRFFKTARGESGQGDMFIGVGLPQLRMLCRECRGLEHTQEVRLLRSHVHEERLLALLLLVDAFKQGSTAERRHIYKLYLANTRFINNWDLVDSSAHHIVGAWLQNRNRARLRRLARSPSVWERRIAIIATLHFIRAGEFDETFLIADELLGDRHDMIHKAAGWMLREVGNRDGAAERPFLKDRYARMPRTMLRYAIEKFPERERHRYLSGVA
jgi:3-methyladenine DNA glycosylase AlkD